MMRKLDQRGVAALEFCLVAVPFVHIDVRHLRSRSICDPRAVIAALANAGSREIMIKCYAYTVKHNNLPTGCTGDPLPSAAAKQAVAPFLYQWRSHAYTERAQLATGGVLTVTASQPGFTMLTPIWGTAFNAPSASTSVPF